MGKAYSSDERSDIKVRIMETALDLYHENGSKTLNIRELAKRAGISQGGFYNFWPDKDSLILDVMKYRATQKLDMIRTSFDDSCKAPVDFLTSQICSWCVDMKAKLDTKPIYREGIDFLQNTSAGKDNRFQTLYSDFLNDLYECWLRAGAVESMDITGVINVITSASILLSNSDKFDGGCFEDLIRAYASSGLKLYIKEKEH